MVVTRTAVMDSREGATATAAAAMKNLWMATWWHGERRGEGRGREPRGSQPRPQLSSPPASPTAATAAAGKNIPILVAVAMEQPRRRRRPPPWPPRQPGRQWRQPTAPPPPPPRGLELPPPPTPTWPPPPHAKRSSRYTWRRRTRAGWTPLLTLRRCAAHARLRRQPPRPWTPKPRRRLRVKPTEMPPSPPLVPRWTPPPPRSADTPEMCCSVGATTRGQRGRILQR
mmetsp:Transcript_34055/g.85737  ORF Transcript_34055/g.85737 Transcript_34055/m.85737 type:complete len:227 (+) Transcript_34055:280-960(+)